jgi:16S rRNA (guanine527-N7)-methyltransferase
MTREGVEAWLEATLDVSRETIDRLATLEAATIAANAEQNLIARSTIETFWDRHILDSAQLLPLAADHPGAWIDLGSGAGFPGLVVALLTDRPVTLVEVRRKRAEHLEAMVALLGLEGRVTVIKAKVEQVVSKPFAVISARAFAPLDRLFELARGLSDSRTIWLLPKGRTVASELDTASRTWQGSVRTVASITDPEGAIVVASDVRPRRRV